MANRGPKLGATPSAGQPKLGAEPESYRNKRPVWRFGAFDWESEWRLTEPSLWRMFDEAIKIFTEQKADDDVREDRKERREVSDLFAQWQQARWAKWAVIVAIGGLAANGLAIWLVWRTFKQAQRTADAAVSQAGASIEAVGAAVRAANASEQALVVAIDTARRQLRAYISVETVTFQIFHVGQPIHVQVRAVNKGQTPAYGTKMMITLAAPALPQSAPLMHVSEEHISDTAIGPNICMEIGAVLRPAKDEPPTLLSQELIDALSTERVALICFGFINYTDAFGAPRSTNVKFQTLAAECKEGRYLLVASNDGNEAT
jgi:hypothetical protein